MSMSSKSLLLIILMLSSCNFLKKTEPVMPLVGLCPEPVKFFKDEKLIPEIDSITFKSEVDSIEITADSDWWWIPSVSFQDSVYLPDLSNNDSFMNDFFLIKKQNQKNLFVKINQNNTKSNRIMTIAIQAGNCHSFLNINQLSN